MVWFLCHIFTQRPGTDRKVERSYACGVGWQQLLTDSIEIFISHDEKKVTCCCQKQSIKTLLTLELSQYRKRGSMFSSSKQVAASSDCSRLENALCLSSPVCPAHCGGEQEQSRRAAPRAWQLILPSNPLITFWNSLWRDCQMTGRSSNLDSNLNSAT